MLQMVALLAMEPPIKLTDEEIRSEKVKVFRALKTLEGEAVKENFVRGQYGPSKKIMSQLTVIVKNRWSKLTPIPRLSLPEN